MKLFYPLLLLFVFSISLMHAQPVNDDCENAIPLTDVINYCSAIGEFSNQQATDSGWGAPSCFSNASNDVWFSFTPVATDVTITIIGNTSPASGGSLSRPEVSLYLGNCIGTLDEEQCESDVGNDIIELYKGGLIIGETYLIRVQGRNNNTGTFQLCINNYNPPVNPGSDCNTEAVLCNKEPFVVQQVTGPGSNPSEANDAPCLNGFGGNVESNSTWFAWTAATSGTLTFTLTPLNPADDLDFVVYSLDGDPQGCSSKTVLRCMASGDFNFPSPCMGPTGLNDANTDTSEPPGCSSSAQDNFLAPIDIEAGRSYAIMVNNFSSSGNGFSIEFGGTAEFQGPVADFTTDDPDQTICIGESITLTDASTFQNGVITGWDWSFGPGASISNATTQGPHTVSYTSPGLKSIVLTVETDRGCIVTEVRNVLVECCSDHFDIEGVVTDALCEEFSGAIDLTVSSDYPPYAFNWSNGATTEDLANIAADDYTITVTDAVTCDTVVTFTVFSPPELVVDYELIPPTCGGGTDGSITVLVSGGAPQYEYNFNNQGFGINNVFTDLSKGIYTVVVRDINGCEVNLDIPLNELELLLDPNVAAVGAPSCNGFSDGSIVVVISNGDPPYVYDWNDGNGFVDDNSLLNVPAGTYTVNVRDANLCEGQFEFIMEEPELLAINFNQNDVTCNGLDDGSLEAVASGGVGGYTYSWDTGATTAQINSLAPGTYTVSVTDANSCEAIASVEIIEPIAVLIDIVEIGDVTCNGDQTGTILAAGSGGVPPYEFSVDSVNYQSDDFFENLAAGDYRVFVRDAMGCIKVVDASIIEPEPLVVDAGETFYINLGQQADLRAISNEFPVGFEWSPAESLDCFDCQDPIASPIATTIYYVNAINENNCIATDSVEVRVFKPRAVYAPTVFSPNGDGINDYYTLFGGVSVRMIKEFKIFDRWGDLVFEAVDITPGMESQGWNGKFREELMQPAVFTFLAEIEFIDNDVISFEGEFALLK